MGCNHRGGIYWLDQRKGMAECLACGTTVFVDDSPSKKPKPKPKRKARTPEGKKGVHGLARRNYSRHRYRSVGTRVLAPRTLSGRFAANGCRTSGENRRRHIQRDVRR